MNKTNNTSSNEIQVITNICYNTPINFDLKEFIKSTLSVLKLSVGLFEFTFIDNKKIKEINKAHLKKTYATDIISFNLGSTTNPIGDIYISTEKAQENAIKLNKDLNSEIKLLIVHGILHLLGYEDYTEKQKQIMQKEEERVLNILENSF